MKQIIKTGILAVCATIIATSVFSQDGDGKLKMKLNYNVGLPVGKFKSDFISNSSFNGVNGEIGYWFNPHVAVGLTSGYQSYYQKYGRQTYKMEGNQSVSAVVSNAIEIMPLMINGTFAPLANSTHKVHPYVTGGIGANFINYNQYLGEFAGGSANTVFAAQAGAGFMVPFGKKLNNAAFQAGATFNYVPYNKNGLSNLNSAGINAGVIFPLK